MFSWLFRRLRRSALAPGRYLTDGRGLFRVLSRFDDGRSLLIVIEHCVSLETYALAALELEALGFRGVGKHSPLVEADRRRQEATAAAGAEAGSRVP